MTVTDKALALAAEFVPVFPLRTDKRPCTEHGFKEASIVPGDIIRMFADPAAALLGMPTGAASDISVVDIDPDTGGTSWFVANQHRLPATRTHRTRREGFHLLFKHRDGVRCSAGSVAPGVDIRGDDGYVVRWDLAGVPIHDTSDIAEMPDWLYDEILKAQHGLRSEMKAPLNPGDLAPTSADHVLRLLKAMPNPPEVGRDDYISICLAVQGTIRGGLATDVLTDDDADQIMDAAAEWAARWEGPTPGDFEAERQKWDIDWGKRENDVSGWRNLIWNARRLGADVAPFTQALVASDFAAVPLPPEEPRTATVAKPRLRLLSLEDVEAQPDPTWLIEGLLPEHCLAVVCGPAKSFKTFLVLSMALHIAAGKPWSGRDVEQGGVVYICGEGAGGLKLRIPAARAKFGIPANIPFWVLPASVPLNNPDAVDGLVKMIRDTAGDTPVKLVVIDTLARAMPGVDENSAGEVGRVVAACDRLKDMLNCTVLPVHHTGKDKDKGMRGSSALDGAVDTLLSVSRDRNVPGANVVQLSTVYQKEGEEGDPLYFGMETVNVSNGRTSLVPVLREGAQVVAERMTPQQQAAFDVLRVVAGDTAGGEVDENTWRQKCVDGRSVSASDAEKTRKEAFKAAFEALVRKRLVEANNGRVRICGAPPRAEDDALAALLRGEPDTDAGLAALLGLGAAPG